MHLQVFGNGFFIRVSVDQQYLRLYLFRLVGKHDLSVDVCLLVLQVFYEHRPVRTGVDLPPLADVLADREEGDLFVVGAVRGGQLEHLGRQLALHRFN